MLKILQINTDRSRTAQDLMLQFAREEGIDVVIASEIYRSPTNDGRWATDPSGKAAIIVTGMPPIQHLWGSSVPGMIAADVGGITFISCYASPAMTTQEFSIFLDAVYIDARTHPHVVLAGDFNGWHQEWGSARTKDKGEELLAITNLFVGPGVA